MTTIRDRLTGHRHSPFIAAVLCGIAGLAVALALSPKLAFQTGTVSFYLVYLALMAWRMPRLSTDYLSRHVRSADEPAPVILTVTLLAAIASVVALFVALSDNGGTGAVELVLAFLSVVCGWMTIHTMFAVHYAHLYWRPGETGAGRKGRHGGLDFPGDEEPCGYDFLYFSFVIGMTAQTSDTEITATSVRKLNLMHSVVSYFFNTVLIAAAVNGAVSLAGG